MYGQGHYAPQLGQSPDRPPRPPLIQQQLSHPPAMAVLTHQVPSAPPHGVIRPAGQQPHAVSPVASAYHSAPPAQSCPSTSMPGSGQCYPPGATAGQNNTTVMQPYPKFQLGAQSAQYTSALPPPLGHSRLPPPPPSQNHNLYRHPVHQPPPSMQQMTLPLSAPALPPPPPTFPLQTSSLPSPATLHSIAPSTSGRAHTSSVTSQLPPLPPAPPPFPPPPPSSSTLQSSVPMSSSNPISSDPSVRSLCDFGSTQAQTSESTENILTQDRNRESLPNRGSDCVIERKLVEASALKRDTSSTPSVTVDVPTSPPRPTNEKTLRNIEILCQYISENGPAFEDMARQNEAGNPGFEFLFGGEPGSEAAIAHEYFLWMKKKSCIGLSQSNLLLKDKHDESRSSVEPNILKETSYSLSDSDMDMEDDIAQPGEKLSVNDEVIPVKQDFVLSVDAIEIQNKDNLLQSSQSGILTMNLGPQIKLEGDDGGRSDKTFDSITRTEDPFRLLKDYASDDSSECDGVHDPVSALQFQEAIPTTFDRSKLQDVSESETTEIGHSGSHMTGAQCEEPKDLDSSLAPSSLAPKINSKEVIRRPSSLEKKVDSTAENNSRADSSKQTTHANLEKKDNLESSGVDLVSESGQREHTKSAGPVKVDEFGRLIREGASETDSDDSGYYRRRGRRGRSRSTSRSPPKRRRRSPWRRKERRSLSRSWSPKRRRSRSRSPLRRVIDTGSKKNTRGRHQMRECFDYLKGRCYRGASCRYLHCDPDKHSQPRHYRSKHHGSETRTSSRDYDYSEENKVTSRKRSLEHGMNGEDGSAVVIDRNNDTAHEGSSVCIHRPSDSKDVTDFSTSDLQNEEKPELPVSCGKDEHVGHSHAESSKQEHRALDNQPLHLKSSYPTSASQISQVSFSQSYLESVGHKELLTADSSATNYPHHVSELQPPLCLPLQPPPPPSSCVASISHVPQPMQNYISAPSEPNVLLSNQHAQYHTPQNLSWGTLPPQCPPSFQQGSLPVRSDPAMHPSLSSTKPTDVPIHPQVGNLQRSYMSMPGSHQPSQHVDAMHPGNLLGQATAGSISTRDDPYVNSLFSGPSPSSPFLPGNIPPRPASTMREANSSIMQSFSHEFLPTGEPSNSGSQNPPYLQQPYGLYQAAGDSFRDPSHHSADLHRNHPSSISDIGPRITAHYNPYASTFDQPLNYKFSSDVFRQGEKTYGRDNSFSLARAPFEAQEVACGVSPMIPSPHSSRAGGQALPKSGGDQYDPLFDSIEPSAESLKKQSAQDDHAADNSDIMLRLSGSKTSDAKLSTEKKVLGDFAAATSSESDEFGETAHAEVLAAEAGSQSNLNDDAEVSAGDVEIYQVKRDGKSKTNKDSRSMKLFKAELASFVKDMLKPSWRQGNMSKEAFKTIVKKTVEKVSGAMKGHRVPKSKAKIDQYIDRSQRKLTSLVEGYVNKYAKA